MILITFNFREKYLNANKESQIDNLIHARKYTVSATSLTYRQANDLDSNNLLYDVKNEKSDGKYGWRKFTLKELVYISVISELKAFGVKRDQMQPLWEAFFKKTTKVGIRNQGEILGRSVGDIAIGCVYCGIEMTLILDNKGNILLVDPYHLLFSFNHKARVQISLNQIVNKILIKIGLEQFPVKYSVKEFIFENFTLTTRREKELLKIIRGMDYSSIKVKKMNGEIALVYAELNNDKNDITPDDLQKLLMSKDFMDISIVKRNGKIVSYKSEETIKL